MPHHGAGWCLRLVGPASRFPHPCAVQSAPGRGDCAATPPPSAHRLCRLRAAWASARGWCSGGSALGSSWPLAGAVGRVTFACASGPCRRLRNAAYSGPPGRGRHSSNKIGGVGVLPVGGPPAKGAVEGIPRGGSFGVGWRSPQATNIADGSRGLRGGHCQDHAGALRLDDGLGGGAQGLAGELGPHAVLVQRSAPRCCGAPWPRP